MVVWWGRQSHANYDLLELANTSETPHLSELPSAADQILQPLKALQEDNPDISVDTMKEAMQSILKDLQYFPDEVREKIDALYPPPPVVEKVEEKDELETMTADEVMNPAT